MAEVVRSRSHTLFSLSILFVLIINVLFGWCFVDLSDFSDDPSKKILYYHDYETPRNFSNEICRSIDIRSSLQTFDQLRNCRVVEGFIQILLFDYVNETALAELSFPVLTEITDYLLLYRVNGLRSIGQLFPNLAVIRGYNTFFGYSFIIFEMPSLQHINLYSLTDVTAGMTRIDKNPMLCHLETIFWPAILHERRGHFIRSIRSENHCTVCRGEEPTGLYYVEKFPKPEEIPCPLHRFKRMTTPRPTETSTFPGYRAPRIITQRRLCWSYQYCQKVCPEHCKSCNSKGECCSPNCMGGCTDHDLSNCTVCRYLSVGTGRDRQCVSHCPTGYYEYLNRRCITFNQCISMRRPFELTSIIVGDYPYRVFNGSCVLYCPANFMNDKNHGCQPCNGRCKRECPGLNVDNVLLARQLRACTHITGSLEIQLRGSVEEVSILEENLSMIEDIKGYLKVSRSFPLVSLNFLRSLKRIQGVYLESQKFSLIVLDNPNLEELFDLNNNRTVIVERGRFFFHYNPKLCLNKIEEIQKMSNLSDFEELEVAPNSNGDRVACDVKHMDVSVVLIKSKAVVLLWRPFKMADERALLGYIVYSIETPYRNISWYDGRNACGGDGWRIDDVPDPGQNTPIYHPLTRLKPYTQYAFYVKTYTVASERRGAQSPMYYFRTMPSVPTTPHLLQAIAEGPNRIRVKWGPPTHAYGKLIYYLIEAKILIYDPDIEDRDYCHGNFPTQRSLMTTTSATVASPSDGTSSLSNDTCRCNGTNDELDADVLEEASRIRFEDELQNQVYVKGYRPGWYFDVRLKRDLFETIGIESVEPQIFPKNLESRLQDFVYRELKNRTLNNTGYWKTFSLHLPITQREYYLKNLRYFSIYDVNVQACREREGRNDQEHHCSRRSVVRARTEIMQDIDYVTNIRIINETDDAIQITWDDPIEPNGFLYCYSIEVAHLDNASAKAQFDCINRAAFIRQNRSFTLKSGSPGNYSIRILTTSSAGSTEYASPFYFTIALPEEPEEVTITIIPIVPLVFESTNSWIYITIVLIISLVIIFVVLGYIRWRYVKILRMKAFDSAINPEYANCGYHLDEWEVPRTSIEMVKELGQGAFGMVYEGVIRNVGDVDSARCAVKTIGQHATQRDRMEFLNEAAVMKGFNAYHVVCLLGVVTVGHPVLVAMELMPKGDLKSYLRSFRRVNGIYDPTIRGKCLDSDHILQMAVEIADGMAYLSSMKYVHRDLAARNCMISENFTIKIGDFGMTRDVYENDYYRKATKGMLPIRWMAPECLKDGLFTTSSDVWSYGVVLWEIVTMAAQPYQGLSNEQVLHFVMDGGVMEWPEGCPDRLYTLMRYCWQPKPSTRPTFLRLVSLMLENAKEEFPMVSFFHSPPGMEARANMSAVVLMSDICHQASFKYNCNYYSRKPRRRARRRRYYDNGYLRSISPASPQKSLSPLRLADAYDSDAYFRTRSDRLNNGCIFDGYSDEDEDEDEYYEDFRSGYIHHVPKPYKFSGKVIFPYKSTFESEPEQASMIDQHTSSPKSTNYTNSQFTTTHVSNVTTDTEKVTKEQTESETPQQAQTNEYENFPIPVNAGNISNCSKEEDQLPLKYLEPKVGHVMDINNVYCSDSTPESATSTVATTEC